MTTVYNDTYVTIYHDNAFTFSRSLPDNSIDAIITSPPYYRQRRYPDDANVFDGTQFGMEKDPDGYVAHTVELFSSFKRILKRTGSVWWNIADTRDGRGALLMIPWRIAGELIKDGWRVVNIVIWAKSNPLCESVRNRLSDTYELIFVFTRSNHHYYDQEAVRQPFAESTVNRTKYLISSRNRPIDEAEPQSNQLIKYNLSYLGANLWDVWVFPKNTTNNDSNIHIAKFPEELPRRAILASVPAYICDICGRPYKRIVDKQYRDNIKIHSHDRFIQILTDTYGRVGSTSIFNMERPILYSTVGWDKTCKCDGGVIPGVVYDPFAGVGTTGVAAKKLGRRAILCDVVGQYVDAAIKLVSSVPLPLSTVLYENDLFIRDETQYQLRLFDE